MKWVREEEKMSGKQCPACNGIGATRTESGRVVDHKLVMRMVFRGALLAAFAGVIGWAVLYGITR